MHKMFGLIQVISSWKTPRMQIYTLKFPKKSYLFRIHCCEIDISEIICTISGRF